MLSKVQRYIPINSSINSGHFVHSFQSFRTHIPEPSQKRSNYTGTRSGFALEDAFCLVGSNSAFFAICTDIIENSVDIAEISGYNRGMITRIAHENRLKKLIDQFPVVAMIGARQVGKTTLARMITRQYCETVNLFDLENPIDISRLADPMLTLERCRGLVVLDEIQQMPDLFKILRVLADRPNRPATFLILGSASPELINKSSESLAGRIAYHCLPPFSVDEAGLECIDQLWLRGGFPLSFLSKSDDASAEWRRQFVNTFLTRDIPQFGIQIPAQTLHRFWSMLAHYHGQVWNSSEFGRSFGVADTTIRRYLDIMQSTFMVTQLQPWFENLKKRQVKSPKIYFTDSGILHSLLNITRWNDLEGHPKVGASWEGFAMNVVKTALGARDDECYFWATHTGAELDLLIIRGCQRLGFEFKRTVSPGVTSSMRIALRDLKLDKLTVIHAGNQSYDLSDRIHAVALIQAHQLTL